MKRNNGAEKRSLRADLCYRYGGKCAYCLVYVGTRGTVDHYVPQSAGGSNDPGNLRWACQRCNSLKANLMPDEWETWLPVLLIRWAPPKSRYEQRVELLQRIATRRISTIESRSHGSCTPDRDSAEAAQERA